MKLISQNPATDEVVWSGSAATPHEIESAGARAESVAAQWAQTPLEVRASHVDRFAEELTAEAESFAQLISQETGKPLWEAKTEVQAMLGKVRLSQEAFQQRRSPTVSESPSGIRSATRYHPLGPCAVLGPYNLPGHLPNAHLIPALLAGNPVIFKPSESTPGVGQRLFELWERSGLPTGVVQLLQGGREVGASLVRQPALRGIFFTGGRAGGQAILEARGTHSEVLIALELGGNNPLLVWEPCPIDAALPHILTSAFITTGQRCTCARRLILPTNAFGDEVVERLIKATASVTPGNPENRPEPFLGPLIHAPAAQRVYDQYESLLAQGAEPLHPLSPATGAFLSPGVVDVSSMTSIPDEECFGPLLQVIRVDGFEEAICAANATKYGLSAGLLCHDESRYEAFARQVRAGIINWNQPLTGASGAQPFGGIGWSGNHRPSGYFAADFCSYPTASVESSELTVPASLPPGFPALS